MTLSLSDYYRDAQGASTCCSCVEVLLLTGVTFSRDGKKYVNIRGARIISSTTPAK